MMKTCSHCSETVRAEARRCQFCHFRFDVTAATWPGKLTIAAAVALGSGSALLVAAPVVAIAPLAIAVALFAIAAYGRRASRKKLFARTGPLPALRAA